MSASDQIELIVSVCAGLVIVDETGIIGFSHLIISGYFEQTQKHWFLNAEKNVIETCVTYLLFKAFETGFCETDEKFKTRLKQHPLYDYAARYWENHSRIVLTDMERRLLELLENRAKVNALFQAMRASGSDPDYSQKNAKEYHRTAHRCTARRSKFKGFS
jgi:hypothetical protein